MATVRYLQVQTRNMINWTFSLAQLLWGEVKANLMRRNTHGLPENGSKADGASASTKSRNMTPKKVCTSAAAWHCHIRLTFKLNLKIETWTPPSNLSLSLFHPLPPGQIHMSHRGEVSLLNYQWTAVCLLHLDPVTGPHQTSLVKTGTELTKCRPLHSRPEPPWHTQWDTTPCFQKQLFICSRKNTHLIRTSFWGGLIFICCSNEHVGQQN